MEKLLNNIFLKEITEFVIMPYIRPVPECEAVISQLKQFKPDRITVLFKTKQWCIDMGISPVNHFIANPAIKDYIFCSNKEYESKMFNIQERKRLEGCYILDLKF